MNLKQAFPIQLLIAGLVLLFYACAAPPATDPTPTPTATLPASGLFVTPGSEWRYFAQDVDQGVVWRFPNFNDADWSTGQAPLGTGSQAATPFNFPGPQPATTYFRRTFPFSPAAFEGELLLAVSAEAGAVVYVNGSEVLRANLPEGEPVHEAQATACGLNTYQGTVSLALLREGENTLAVEVHPCSGEESGLLFDLALGIAPAIAQVMTPQPSPTPSETPSGDAQAGGSQPSTAEPTQTPVPPTPAPGAFYVSPQGGPQGDGSRQNPWDLQTALDKARVVKPGDTVWLAGGTYGTGYSTKFKIRLAGAEGKPVTVRALPGERVTIDGTIEVLKPWTTVWGLEVMNSDPDRISTDGSSHPGDINRLGGIDVFAPHASLINNVIHDTRQGSGFWSDAPDSEMYGNVIYNNGWSAPDRGHGHGVYTQNEAGTKRIRENIIFSNFSGYNLHAYSTNGFLNGFRIEGNILFNGVLLVGSETQPADDIVLVRNYLYNSQVQLGYRAPGNGSLVLQDNKIHLNGGRPLEIKWWEEVLFSGNQIWGNGISLLSGETPGAYSFDGNTYLSLSSPDFELDGAGQSWGQWQGQAGLDPNSSLTSGTPTGFEVAVLPNQYETKRANIAIYNWDRQESIPVDLSLAGLAPGDPFTLHNVQDFYGQTFSGVYDGNPVMVPMTGWQAAPPVGWGELLAPNTFPEFGAFVLVGG